MCFFPPRVPHARRHGQGTPETRGRAPCLRRPHGGVVLSIRGRSDCQPARLRGTLFSATWGNPERRLRQALPEHPPEEERPGLEAKTVCRLFARRRSRAVRRDAGRGESAGIASGAARAAAVSLRGGTRRAGFFLAARAVCGTLIPSPVRLSRPGVPDAPARPRAGSALPFSSVRRGRRDGRDATSTRTPSCTTPATLFCASWPHGG